MKMKAAVLYEQGLPRPYADSRPLQIEEVDLDAPGEGEVLVKVSRRGALPFRPLHHRQQPAAHAADHPGHEGAGVVAEVGRGITDLKAGDHVVFIFVPSCGTCRNCARGRPNVCQRWPEMRARGELLTGGTQAEPQRQVHRPLLRRLLLCRVCGRRALLAGEDRPQGAAGGCGDVRLRGADGRGRGDQHGRRAAGRRGGRDRSRRRRALAACWARAWRARRRIIAVDLSDEKLGLARQLGATDTYNAADPDCASRDP